MNRLQTELHRLYLPNDAQSECQDTSGEAISLIDADGRVRAMVVEIAQQANWDGVAALWQGIQDDLDLPAPRSRCPASTWRHSESLSWLLLTAVHRMS